MGLTLNPRPLLRCSSPQTVQADHGSFVFALDLISCLPCTFDPAFASLRTGYTFEKRVEPARSRVSVRDVELEGTVKVQARAHVVLLQSSAATELTPATAACSFAAVPTECSCAASLPSAAA